MNSSSKLSGPSLNVTFDQTISLLKIFGIALNPLEHPICRFVILHKKKSKMSFLISDVV